MKKNHLLSLLFLLTSIANSFAQDDVIKDTVFKQKQKISFLDSIKKTFVVYKNAKKIDSLWMKDMVSLTIYDDLIGDIKNIDVDQKIDFELSTELLKERLKKMDEKSPFNIEYNVGLENVIKSFLKNRKKSFERLMGLSQFYFPLFEEELAKNNIPLEIKYLAVVESALNTRAVSRVGATGLWQFMYQTGKQYGLKINSFVDERNEPLASSKAASQYMTNMFKIFNDWDLVLAAYNSGPGNVAKAIRRSGGQQNYWNIRRNLPKETQGYLPAFLATMYIFEYHKEHGIVPNKAVARHFTTDTIQVKKAMTFKQISNLLDISIDELQFFNPSFKRNEIPYVTGEINFLTLPKDKIAIFTSNEDKIYAYLENEVSKRERPNENFIASRIKDSVKTKQPNDDSTSKFVIRTKKYTVRKGENLAEVANKFGVNTWDLKKWNGLKSNKIKSGRSLKILVSEQIAYKDELENDSKNSAKETQSNPEIVTDTKISKTFVTEKIIQNKEVKKYHTVKKGETLGEISQNYNVTLSELKKWNFLKSNNVALGKKLKIVTNEKVVVLVKKEIKSVPFKNETATNPNTTDQAQVLTNSVKIDSKNQKFYVVEKGDNLYAIAHKNNVTVAQLIEWNDLKDNNVTFGSQLIIPNEEQSKQTEKKSESKKHIVSKGENLKTIAAKYAVSQSKIKEWNTLKSTDLQVGQELIVLNTEAQTADSKKPVKIKKEAAKDYLVRKGDSLFSISKKFPGVTIADLKKWNNIKDDGLMPGMKLKING